MVICVCIYIYIIFSMADGTAFLNFRNFCFRMFGPILDRDVMLSDGSRPEILYSDSKVYHCHQSEHIYMYTHIHNILL